MRSRVMPGSLVTMARRVPVKRLKSVDLPTLGRPTITRDGRSSGIGSWAGCTLSAAAYCSTFQCSVFRVASEGKWAVIRGQWSVKTKTGINAEVAENTPTRSGQAPFAETKPEEASNRFMGETAESWLVDQGTPHPLFFVSVASKGLIIFSKSFVCNTYEGIRKCCV